MCTYNRKVILALTAVLPMLFLSACGGQTYRDAVANQSSASTFSQSSSSGSNNSSNNNGTNDNNGSSTNNLPPIDYDFQNQGSTGNTVISGIATDDLLKVDVSLGQPTTIPGTGYTAMYSCARIKVTVSGQSQTVFLTNLGVDITSANGFSSQNPCFGAVSSASLDFSSRCTLGHGPMSITVTNVSYDNCRLYGNVYGYWCPLTSVYSTHILTGHVSIHTNSTN
jgi:hypothetical protein